MRRRRAFGISTVDVRDVRRDGRRLVYRRDGRLVPIARIYNRVVPDDLISRRATLAFDYRDDLDVEWAGGPDWFFRISKFSLPWLRHPWVPETHFLDEVVSPPHDREDWLLKPLFSFAGGGIVFAPTDAHLPRSLPARHDTSCSGASHYAGHRDAEGTDSGEIRVMLVDDGDVLQAGNPLVRMGRGKMMGVDHNKGFGWVGASAALLEKSKT